MEYCRFSDVLLHGRFVVILKCTLLVGSCLPPLIFAWYVATRELCHSIAVDTGIKLYKSDMDFNVPVAPFPACRQGLTCPKRCPANERNVWAKILFSSTYRWKIDASAVFQRDPTY